MVMRGTFGLGILLCASMAAAAEPELQAVFPLGAARGAATEISVRGSGLENAQAVFFSHPGLTAESLGKGRFQVTVGDGVPDGDHDLWVVTADGLSNPRRFAVGDVPEVVAQEKRGSPETAQEVSLPVVVNAHLAPAAALDWYRFEGEQGQRVTICCRSQSLDGTLEPALALVGPQGRELLHSRGDELEPTLHAVLPETGAYFVRVADRAYRSDPHSVYRLSISTGPRLLAAFPHLLTRSSTRTVTLYGYGLPDGRPIEPGDSAGAESLQVEIEAPAQGDADGGGWTASAAAQLEGFRYRHPGVSGSVRLLLTDAAPVIVEAEESNGRPESAQPITLPADVAGRFLTPGDRDWFRFSAKKGETLSIETFGDRLANLMDLDVTIHDAKGKPLTTLNDFAPPKDVPAKFPLESLDAAGEWKSPSDGEYLLVVRDLYGVSVSGPQRLYRLSIGRAAPGFQVFAVHPDDKAPRGVSLLYRGTDGPQEQPAGTAKLQLVAVRTGGFDGSIRIRPGALPDGLTAEEAVIPAKKTTAVLTISADDQAEAGVRLLDLIASAESDSGSLESPVRGATLVRPGTPAVTRLTAGVVIAVIKKD